MARNVMIVINRNNYFIVIPAVKNEKEYFLKIIFPSRRYTLK
jgi:hypothetical protein